MFYSKFKHRGACIVYTACAIKVGRLDFIQRNAQGNVPALLSNGMYRSFYAAFSSTPKMIRLTSYRRKYILFRQRKSCKPKAKVSTVGRLDMLPFLFFAFLFLSLTAIFRWYWTIPKNLPPGPAGLPFLGSVLDTIDVSKNHLLLQAWARKYGSLFKFYITNRLVVVLGDYECIQEALIKQAQTFSGRPDFLTFVPDSIHNLGKLAAACIRHTHYKYMYLKIGYQIYL